MRYALVNGLTVADDTETFSTEHAYKYFCKVLRGNGRGTATATPGETVRGRNGSSDSHTKGYKIDENLVCDLVQTAFVKWWESRKGNRVPLDVRGSCRFTLREHFRQNRRLPVERVSELSPAAPDILRELVELVPLKDNTDTDKKVRLLVKWVSSGATFTQIAERLGVSPRYVNTLVRRFREAYGTNGEPQHTVIPRPVASEPAGNLDTTTDTLRPLPANDYTPRTLPGIGRSFPLTRAGLSVVLDKAGEPVGEGNGFPTATLPDPSPVRPVPVRTVPDPTRPDYSPVSAVTVRPQGKRETVCVGRVVCSWAGIPFAVPVPVALSPRPRK